MRQNNVGVSLCLFVFDVQFRNRNNVWFSFGVQIAEHVVGQHMYRAPGEDGHSIVTDAQERCILALHGRLMSDMQHVMFSCLLMINPND